MVKFGVTAHNCVVFFYNGMVKKIGPRLRDPASCSFHGSRRASSCNLGFTYLTILLLNKALSPLFTLQYSRVFPPLGAGTGWDSQNILEINLLCLVLYAMIYWIKLLIYLVLKFPWSVLGFLLCSLHRSKTLSKTIWFSMKWESLKGNDY